MIKAVIFDFDGVIADSLPAVEKAATKVFKRLKYPFPAISREDDLRKILMVDMKLNTFQRLRLVKGMKKEITLLREYIQVFAGMRELLTQLSQKTKVIILSSNSEQAINSLLQKHHFPTSIEIISDSSLFGKDRVLKRVLKNHQLTPREVVYIGDEVRDVVACNRVNIPILTVTWG